MGKRTPIRTVYIENNGGLTFGRDRLTPCTFVFSNRVPKLCRYSYVLDLDNNEAAQQWMRENKRSVMTWNALVKKLKEFQQ